MIVHILGLLLLVPSTDVGRFPKASGAGGLYLSCCRELDPYR